MATSEDQSHGARNAVRLPLRLEPQPEGGWVITSPLVPELITEADTGAEVFSNVLDAWRVVLEIYEDEGRALPAELYVVEASTEPVVELPEGFALEHLSICEPLTCDPRRNPYGTIGT